MAPVEAARIRPTRVQALVLWIGALIGVVPGLFAGAFGTALVFLHSLPDGLEPLPTPLRIFLVLAGLLVGGFAGLVTLTIPMATAPRRPELAARVAFALGALVAGWLASPFVILIQREGLDPSLAVPLASLAGALLVGGRIAWIAGRARPTG